MKTVSLLVVAIGAVVLTQASLAAPANYTWTHEYPDTAAATGTATRVAVGATDAHVVYWDGVNNQLKYVHRISGGWSAPEVIAFNGQNFGLAVDPQGRPHVSFLTASRTGYTVTHAVRQLPSGPWTLSPVESVVPPATLGATAIAAASDGSVHIAYVSGFPNNTMFQNQIKYAVSRGDSGPWSPGVVDPGAAGFTMSHPAIAVDSTGRPGISYDTYIPTNRTQQLMYAGWNGASWAVNVAAGGNVDNQSLAIGANGVPQIAFYGNGGLRYTTLVNGQGWTTAETISTTANDLPLAIIVDHDGTPHVAYEGYPVGATNGTLPQLFYASRTSPSWTLATPDVTPGSGAGISAAMSSTGFPSISYGYTPAGTNAAAVLKFTTLVKFVNAPTPPRKVP
jgi:hypothetical protein